MNPDEVVRRFAQMRRDRAIFFRRCHLDREIGRERAQQLANLLELSAHMTPIYRYLWLCRHGFYQEKRS